MHLIFQSTYLSANSGNCEGSYNFFIPSGVCNFGSSQKSGDCYHSRIIVNKGVLCRIEDKNPINIIYSQCWRNQNILSYDMRVSVYLLELELLSH